MAVHGREPKKWAGDLGTRAVPGDAGTAVWRYLLAAALALHGLIHVVGFAAAWQVGGLTGATATPSFPGVEAGTPAALALGVMWLAPALGFVLGGAALALRGHWWSLVTAGAAILSLGLCSMWWQTASIGIAVDVLVLGFLALLASPLGRPAEGGA
jgi:hypothetical protein